MNVKFKTLHLKKRVPLAISRGVSTGSVNLYVLVEEDGLTGIGECAPGTGFDDTLAAQAERSLGELVASGLEGLSVAAAYDRGAQTGLNPSALAALDVALWDLLAKKAGMPLYRLLGLSKPVEPTSVTVGITPVDAIADRVRELLDSTGGKSLKIKLGSKEGIEADQASYAVAVDAAKRFGARVRVDANGGWTPKDARTMIAWLAERDCDYVEQPLEAGREEDLPGVFQGRRLPIFLDESCRVSADVPKLADRCDGVNLKLMKTGGITEALRLVATARAHGLKTMIGCMGESSVAIAAGAAIGSLFDHIDLDSHLNLNPDPAQGLSFEDGVVTPSDEPGHGASLAVGN